MIYRFTGTDMRRYRLWRYYIHLAVKSRTMVSVNRWLKLAKVAIDG